MKKLFSSKNSEKYRYFATFMIWIQWFWLWTSTYCMSLESTVLYHLNTKKLYIKSFFYEKKREYFENDFNFNYLFFFAYDEKLKLNDAEHEGSRNDSTTLSI